MQNTAWAIKTDHFGKFVTPVQDNAERSDWADWDGIM